MNGLQASQRKRRGRDIVALVFAGIVLAGCVLIISGVYDLRFVDVEPVKVGTLDLHDTWGDLRPHLPLSYTIGKVTVATKADIHEIGKDSELNIWHELTLCKTGALVIDWPAVYYRGVDINTNSTTEAVQSLYRDRAAAHKANEPYIYEIYFDPRSTRRLPRGVGQPWALEPYDLVHEPQDLCLRIGGGNMLGGYFASNVVVIPGIEITHAFQNAQQ
jgi:hypothetical protein